MLRLYAGERAQVFESKLFYRGYELEVKRARSGWRVGIYPRTADLPILSRCEVAALDQDEAVVMAEQSRGRRDFALELLSIPFWGLSLRAAV